MTESSGSFANHETNLNCDGFNARAGISIVGLVGIYQAEAKQPAGNSERLRAGTR